MIETEVRAGLVIETEVRAGLVIETEVAGSSPRISIRPTPVLLQ